MDDFYEYWELISDFERHEEVGKVIGEVFQVL